MKTSMREIVDVLSRYSFYKLLQHPGPSLIRFKTFAGLAQFFSVDFRVKTAIDGSIDCTDGIDFEISILGAL